MKKTKLALLHSVLALLLCVSMLVGTTFAWFTDEIVSGNNRIVAGNLDVELEYYKDEAWHSVHNATDLFTGALWEPGHTEVVYLRLSNRGSLALKYQLGINIVSETAGVNVAGDSFKLSEHIYMGVVGGAAPAYTSREAALAAAKAGAHGLIANGYTASGTMTRTDAPQYLALVVYMPETVGNEANYREDAVPKIELGINLVATQYSSESDSFGNNYDAGATYPPVKINFSASESVAEKVENGQLTEPVTVGNVEDKIYAAIPDGVKLADGAEELKLTVNTKEESEADIVVSDNETATSLDIHVEGVAEDNAVPMQITLKGIFSKGLNSTSVKMYHVENGTTVEMTLVPLAELDAHNEFSYDPATGDVILSVASFSEYVTVENTANPWDGKTAAPYVDAEGTEANPIIIENAEQFVYFRNQVDAGVTYEGKFIKLDENINLGGHNFDPIGWGYDYASYNKDGAVGKVFKGTFDGNYKTIYGLYQSGWALEESTGTDYTYTNCGFGLFASVCNATIKNLTISGANIVVECVEAGVLVGLSQGDCTYENINIYGCKIANYQRPAGGLIGEVSGNGTTKITYVNIDSTTVVGSLWGDFDTPVGGVIGARWDNENADPQIVMTNVNVACRLDVYNDVTSTYQWYAYRRAGMLIGNTEQSADHKALADFLTCTNVVVCYGDWVNYHYCEFNNHNSNWPWVRVEEGENCNAYSNPRYGVPNDPVTGVPVKDSLHSHEGEDEHLVLLPFKQLYGGGQGVYGAETHTGVTEAKYTITYINYGEVLGMDLVMESDLDANSNYTIKRTASIEGKTFIAWTDANDNHYAEGSTITLSSDIVLYPVWGGEYTINFLDAENNLLYYEVFISGMAHTLDQDAVDTALANLQNRVDASKEVIEVSWDTTTYDFVNAESNIIVKAVYTLKNSTITLTPVYAEDGVTIVSYSVSDVAETEEYKNIAIPSHVGTIPVETISDDAFAGYENLVSVVIPETITSISTNAFEDGADWTVKGGRQTITIYYEGSATMWKQYMDNFYKNNSYYTSLNALGTYDDDATILKSGWDSGLGDGSRIFFLGPDGKVDNSCYWELYYKNYGSWYSPDYQYTWVFHNHAYEQGIAQTHDGCNYVSSDQYTDYINDTLKDGSERPDKGYWTPVTATAATTEE